MTGRNRRRRVVLAALSALALMAVPAGCSTGSEPTITITSPQHGETVAAGEKIIVRVDIQGGYIQGTPGKGRPGHIHLYVDRKLVQMTDELAPTVILTPGTHLITAEFAGENHEALGITDEVEVTAK